MAKGHIALVGLDRVGIALALAIKTAVPGSAVVLVDPENRRLREAGKYGKFDGSQTSLVAGCRDAALVILNLATSQLQEAFTQIAPVLSTDAVLLDLGGVKEEAVRLAAELLPAHVRYMGCHLILHPERAAQTEPSATFFHGAVLCMTPATRADEGVIKIGSDLAKALGARPYFLEPGEHDAMVAAVEGLPSLLSVALALTTLQSEAWSELAVLAGPIYDQALLPLSNTALDEGAALTLNRVHLLRWLDALQVTLRDLRHLIDEGQTEPVGHIIAETVKKHADWLDSKPVIAWTDEAGLPPSTGKYKRANPLSPYRG